MRINDKVQAIKAIREHVKDVDFSKKEQHNSLPPTFEIRLRKPSLMESKELVEAIMELGKAGQDFDAFDVEYLICAVREKLRDEDKRDDDINKPVRIAIGGKILDKLLNRRR